MYGNFFPNLRQLSLKNAWLPPIFFLDSDSPCKDLLFPHSHTPRKNTFVFIVRKFRKKLEYLGPDTRCAERMAPSLSPNIKMHILLTVLHTRIVELLRGIYPNIKASYL